MRSISASPTRSSGGRPALTSRSQRQNATTSSLAHSHVGQRAKLEIEPHPPILARCSTISTAWTGRRTPGRSGRPRGRRRSCGRSGAGAGPPRVVRGRTSRRFSGIRGRCTRRRCGPFRSWSGWPARRVSQRSWGTPSVVTSSSQPAQVCEDEPFLARGTTPLADRRPLAGSARDHSAAAVTGLPRPVLLGVRRTRAAARPVLPEAPR